VAPCVLRGVGLPLWFLLSGRDYKDNPVLNRKRGLMSRYNEIEVESNSLWNQLSLLANKIGNNSLGYQPEGEELDGYTKEYKRTHKRLTEVQRKLSILKRRM